MAGANKLFETPKKAVITVGCVLVALAVAVVGAVYVMNVRREKSSIGAENAKNFAFVDAGVDPVDAQDVRVKFEHKQGQFVYEVEFAVEHRGGDLETAYGYPVSVAEYEYWINASDGSVVKKEVAFLADGGDINATLAETSGGDNGTGIENNVGDSGTDTGNNVGDSGTASAYIGIEQAKASALADAGVTKEQVTYTKAEFDYEDGVPVYDIEFYTSDKEYEYEIHAQNGSVYSRDADVLAGGTGNNGSGNSTGIGNNVGDSGTDSAYIGIEQAKASALADAGVTKEQVTYTKAEFDYEDGVPVYDIEFYTSDKEYEYEIHAQNGSVYSRDADVLAGGTGNNGSGNSTGTGNSGGDSGTDSAYIGIEQAKAIAAGHAGLSAADVIFSKAELDHEDGFAVYEVEFYIGSTEYEYEINALTGDILEYDRD